MSKISFLLLWFFTPLCLANNTDNLTHVHLGTGCSSGSYQVGNGIHTLWGVGADVWNASDECDFAYIRLPGDIEIVARVTSCELVNNWTKAGVMIRGDLNPLSKYAYTLYAPQDLVAFQNRTVDNANCEDARITNTPLPYWVKLMRKGNVIVSQVSSDGSHWNTIRAISMDLPVSVYYGLAVTSHVVCTEAKAEFDNVSISENTGSSSLLVEVLSGFREDNLAFEQL